MFSQLFSLFQHKKHTENESSLLRAARIGDINLMEKMLAAGTNIECRDCEFIDTPLLIAIRYGQLTAVKRLLDHDANYTATDKYGFHALTLSAYLNQVETAKLILKAGADIESKTNINHHSIYGDHTALGIAASKGHTNMLAFLLGQGADVNAVCMGGRTPLMIGSNHSKITAKLLAKGAVVNAQDDNGRTALMNAVLSRNAITVNLLLEHRARTSLKDKDGETAFSFAHNRFNDETCLRILNNHVSHRHHHHYGKNRHHHEAHRDLQPSTRLRK